MLAHFFHWLNSDPVSGTSNLLGFVSIVGGVSWLVHRWEHQCRAHRLCLREGQVQVKGTTWKTCPKHSTFDAHKTMTKRHRLLHPERRGHAL